MEKKPPQKSNVIALRGELMDNVITQQHLRDLETAQRAEWAASKRAALLSESIKTAAKHGATFEHGPLCWDAELEMVRSRKAGGE